MVDGPCVIGTVNCGGIFGFIVGKPVRELTGRTDGISVTSGAGFICSCADGLVEGESDGVSLVIGFVALNTEDGPPLGKFDGTSLGKTLAWRKVVGKSDGVKDGISEG